MGNKCGSPDSVRDVEFTNYDKIPIFCREDCLVLYGPDDKKHYELLIDKPIPNSPSKVYSLSHVDELKDAQSSFDYLKDVIPPLVNIMADKIITKENLQTLCNLLRDHQTWTVAHIAAFLDYSKAFDHKTIASSANTQESELKQTPLHLAIKHENIDTVRKLLEIKVSTDVIDAKENSIYHFAAQTNKELMELVCKQKSPLLNQPNGEGKTPLHVACESDKPKCVKALLDAGADINIPVKTDESMLPIHTAIAANSCQSVKEIIAKHPKLLNVQDKKTGETPLYWATSGKMINALADLECQFNVKNIQGETALHKMVQKNHLSGVVTLLCISADVNAADNDGNTPMHKATTPAVLQALLVFGANAKLVNSKDETALHIIANCSSKDKDHMLHILHAIGSPRCCKCLPTCNEGCASSECFTGKAPVVEKIMKRSRINLDGILENAMEAATMTSDEGSADKSCKSGGRILCLDGGGIKGLILVQLLLAIQEATGGRPILELFDWIAGTSTGGILAVALALGKTARYAQGLYFRIKDMVFVGNRPYDATPLEEMLKKELGAKTVMSDIKGVKVIVTGCLADRAPADLHLFHNYENPERLLGITASDESPFDVQPPPHEQLVWQAARSSGAAPSYFRSSGSFIDGGLIANNPTLDVLTEIEEYNTSLKNINRASECDKPRVVVSLGTGRAPVSKVDTIDCFMPADIFEAAQAAFGMSNVFKLIIDQACMADNRVVDRARSWCSMCSIPYLRLNPQLPVDVQMDETNDEVLVNALWETMVYIQERREQIQKFANLLTRGL